MLPTLKGVIALRGNVFDGQYIFSNSAEMVVDAIRSQGPEYGEEQRDSPRHNGMKG